MQLPPLVSSEAAEKGGKSTINCHVITRLPLSLIVSGPHLLPKTNRVSFPPTTGFGISLLKRLADKHPSCVAQLALQYRMHSDICQLSNDLMYKGKLECASEQVQNQQLNLPGFPDNIPAVISPQPSSWLMTATDPCKPVVFLDTDQIMLSNAPSTTANDVVRASSNDLPRMALERSSGRGGRGGNIVNDTEASLVCVVVDTLVGCGLPSSSIGVVCPFRAQVKLVFAFARLLLFVSKSTQACPYQFVFSLPPRSDFSKIAHRYRKKYHRMDLRLVRSTDTREGTSPQSSCRSSGATPSTEVGGFFKMIVA